jgi:hypothetical protein
MKEAFKTAGKTYRAAEYAWDNLLMFPHSRKAIQLTTITGVVAGAAGFLAHNIYKNEMRSKEIENDLQTRVKRMQADVETIKSKVESKGSFPNSATKHKPENAASETPRSVVGRRQ